MLYSLVERFGITTASRMLGFEPSAAIIGYDLWVDAYASRLHVRAIWFLWSLQHCPSNLSDPFHIQTWGVFNDKYHGDIPDEHRRRYLKKLSSQRKPALKSQASKAARTRARRIARLPRELRYVSDKNSERYRRRAALLDEIRKQDERQRRAKAKRGREARARTAALRKAAKSQTKKATLDNSYFIDANRKAGLLPKSSG